MTRTKRAAAWSMWLMGALFYAYQFILRVSPSIMMQDIMTHFHMDTATFGQFCGVYYIGYALFHLPLGLAFDRFGPRKVLPVCIIFTVLGTLPMIMAQHWIWPTAGRFLMGIGSSAAILGSFKIIRMGFEEKHFTRMLSLCVSIGLVGAIYGGGPVAYLCQTFGTNAVLEVLCVLGIALAVATYMVIPNIQEAPRAKTPWAQIKEVLTNRRVLTVCFLAGLMVGPMEGFADVWGSAFLEKVYGLEATRAKSLPSLIFVGMCFGAPFLSALAAKVRSDLGVITLSAATMLGVFAVLLTGHLTIANLSIGFIMVGVASAYQIIAIYKASTYVGEDIAGLTTALANMIIMGFGYAFHAAIGGVIQLSQSMGEKVSFTYGISVIVAALVLGAAGFATLLWQERRGQIARA
ncbi:MAG: MFS transporter [Candidatus Puniceispirillum sp.]|nr:MFS transporter [Candidatus Puniceispirillum sp.]